jgi:hypothetical protein
MVPVPTAPTTTALTAAVSLALRVSSGSATRSPTTFTLTGMEVWPGARVRLAAADW